MNFRKLSAAFLAGLIAGSTIQPAYARDIETDHEEIIGTDAACLEGNVSQSDAADSGTSFELPIEVQFCQTEARTEFDMINEFRTGDDAWYWNEDNTEKIYVNGLKELEYDYDLEKVAMQRAVEIAVYYSHSRPDGKSCWDTYDDLGYNWVSTVGENIAAGYRTAESVFVAWREDDDDYSGQGHRRNMLNSAFQAVGLGCVYYEGYYYWVQEFAGKALNTTATTANDELSIESAAVSNENADVWQLSTDTLDIDNTQEYDISELMSVNYKLKIAGWSPQARVRKSKYVPEWQPEDTSVVTFANGKLKGLKSGSTVMNGLSPDGGTELKVTVNVTADHTWGEPSYAWSDDNSKVTATVKCTDCDETIEETVSTTYEVIKEATCDEKGTGRYTAAFTNDLFTTQTKDVEIDAVGHDYKFSAWEWAEDYSSAKAVFVCANDESHTEKVTATVTSVRTEPTCAAEGSIVYTASVTFEGNTYTDTKSVVLEKTDHVYGEPVYTWAADFSTVTAKAVCTVCGDEVTETVNTTYEVIKAATAEEDGKGRYTAVFTNEMFETQTKDITLPATGHTYGTPEYTWAEDNKTVTAVVKCTDCDREITETVDTVYEVIKAPGCEEKGTGRYSAYFANELFTTQTKDVEIDAIGHNYGEPEYTWAVDFKTVTAKAVCENCGDEITETVETTYEVIKEATLEETGTGKYTAVFTNEMFETQTKEVEIPALSDKSPKEIHIDQSELSILCNASVKLNAEVLPEDAEDKTVTWSSSDESVAIVGANGTVRGIKPGKVTITATTVNGLTDTCEIRVLFSDVAIRSRYYYTPVYWAFDRNITVGYGGVDLFSPDYSVTRGQFVTFLYRLAGEPEVTEDSGFDDVDPAKFYANSIAWAASNGITTGYAGRNEFGPDDKCTREQIVTFLWRYAESPKPEKAVNFTDSRPNAYYLDALSWAAEKEITVGLNDGTGRFGVGMNCTRGMTVTFLYRFDQNK